MTCSMHEVMEGKDMTVFHKMRRGPKSRGMFRAHAPVLASDPRATNSSQTTTSSLMYMNTIDLDA